MKEVLYACMVRAIPLLVPLIIMLTVFFIGYISISFFGDDNPLEEACEQYIEKQSGIKIDFSKNERK